MLVNEIKAYYKREIEIINSLNFEEIDKAIGAIIDAYERETTIFIFGNGGSAATAIHYANDFNKGISEYFEKKFNMICLCDNVATVMAIANDISYDEVFLFQLKNRLKSTDLVIGISGSGNSINVVKAVEYAREVGTPVLGITGYTGGKLRKLSDYHLHVPVDDMQITEDIHMTFDHMMYKVIGDLLNGYVRR